MCLQFPSKSAKILKNYSRQDVFIKYYGPGSNTNKVHHEGLKVIDLGVNWEGISFMKSLSLKV